MKEFGYERRLIQVRDIAQNNYLISISTRIRELREVYNLTQTDLGKLVGVSKNCISSYENGEYFPSLLVIAKINFLFPEFGDVYEVGVVL